MKLSEKEQKILLFLYEDYMDLKSFRWFSYNLLEIATKINKKQLYYPIRKLREKDLILSEKGSSIYKGMQHRLTTKGLKLMRQHYS